MMEANASVRKRAAKCIIPSAILINNADEKVFKDITDESKSTAGNVARITGSALAALGLNVAASYIFAAIHG
jgi:hypothetical protein